MTVKQLQKEILNLKRKENVTILAHYYQPIEIQEIADHLGDSLGLSRKAKEETNSDYIIFAGVDFMAETASILNQEKHVLLPHPESCCPMAAFLTPEKVTTYRNDYPDLPVVVYVNSTAAVKAKSDICCTSSNAVKIVKKISREFNVDKVLFGPDTHLADYAEQISNIKTIKMPSEGHCYVHSKITPEHIKNVRNCYPEAILIVHPECVRAVRDSSDFVGSTAQMYKRVKNSSANEKEFIIGTEMGLLERLSQDFPNKKFYLAKEEIVCHNMKKHNLDLIKYLLKNLDDKTHEVKVSKEIAKRALKPIEKMLEYS
jgi:quinolinate synthase